MARLGFIGLGIMGAPMARNLRQAGHEVAVWSHGTKKAKAFADANGATLCPDPASVAQASECGSRAIQTSTNPGSFPGILGGATNNINNSTSVVLNEVHLFTPSLVNEARFGYTRHNGSINVLNTQQGVDFANQNGVAVYPFPIQTFPQFLFSYSGSSTGGTQEFTPIGPGGPNLNIENLFEGADDLSWNKGNHSLKIGSDVRRDRFDAVNGGPQTVFG